jgi:hypothetical protein
MASIPSSPSRTPISGAPLVRVNMTFEVVVIPVEDVDRSKTERR